MTRERIRQIETKVLHKLREHLRVLKPFLLLNSIYFMAKAGPKLQKGGLKALPELDETLVVTKEGLKALEEELADLKTRGRKEVAERLKSY